jgi:transcriptional regulator with XRE-family HTH domain
MSIPINEKIKKARAAKNMTQTAFAALAGVSQNTLSEYESGKYIPSAQYIKRLNELGANIRPSVFTLLVQKLVATILVMAMPILQRDKVLQSCSLETKNQDKLGIRIKPKDGLWITCQLKLKGISQTDIAAKLGIHPGTVNSILRGNRHSTRIEDALYQTLVYPSFEAMIADCRKHGGIA